MSAEAQAHVWRFSPYSGHMLAVHLAIADSANDQHGYEFFMTNATLAAKVRTDRTRVNKSIRRLVEDGWLEVVDRPMVKLHRGVRCYRFVFRPGLEPRFDVSRRVASGHTSGPSMCGESPQVGVATRHTELKTELKSDVIPQTGSRARSTRRGGEPEAAEVERAVRDLAGDEAAPFIESARRHLRR